MVREWMERMLSDRGNESAADIRSEMQAMMDDKASVFRTEQSLTEARDELRAVEGMGHEWRATITREILDFFGI